MPKYKGYEYYPTGDSGWMHINLPNGETLTTVPGGEVSAKQRIDERIKKMAFASAWFINEQSRKSAKDSSVTDRRSRLHAALDCVMDSLP